MTANYSRSAMESKRRQPEADLPRAAVLSLCAGVVIGLVVGMVVSGTGSRRIEYGDSDAEFMVFMGSIWWGFVAGIGAFVLGLVGYGVVVGVRRSLARHGATRRNDRVPD